MGKGTTKEMTSGSTMKLILGFAVPLLMGMLFQQVYGLVDTIIVAPLSWCIRARRCGCYRKYQLSDHRILSGNLQWIRASDRAAFRCKRL